MSVLKPADVSAARIIALGLVGDVSRTPHDAVVHLGCMQGQDLRGVLTSIALRSASRDLNSVTQAFNDGLLVRSWTQRGTIHSVAAQDVGWVLSLTGERMQASFRRRRVELGLDSAVLAQAEKIACNLISEGGPATRAQITQAWAEQGIDTVENRSYHLVTVLCQRGVLAQGPFLNKPGRVEQLFVIASEWITAPLHLSREEALSTWLTRYARSHGPATVADTGRWSGLPLKDCRQGLEAGRSSGQITTIDIDGVEHWIAPNLVDDLGRFQSEADELHLLPGFDELILGYKDRTATISRENEKYVVPGNNGMFKATVVHKSGARGTWRRGTRVSDPSVVVAHFPGERINEHQVERTARRLPNAAIRGRQG